MLRSDVAGSWADLVSRLDADQAVTRWAATEPALTGVSGVGELAALTREGGDRARADDVLGALVRWAAADGGDDPDAVLVVLHLLAPGVFTLAGRLADLDATGDTVALVTGQLAIEIRRFPWRRRCRAFAANLLLDSRRAVLRELGIRRGSPVREVPVGLAVAERDRAFRPAAATGALPARVELVDVLVWALRRRVAGPMDLQLLWRLELMSGHGAAAAARAGAASGVHERTARRRQARTLTALQAAASEYLAA